MASRTWLPSSRIRSSQTTLRGHLSALQEAFRSRWIHGLNTQSPWSFVIDVISQNYDQFLPIPWFIGEYGGNGQDEDLIRADLQSMQSKAREDDSFLGAAFFQFQTTYWKGGAEMNFGLFGLGDDQIGETGEVCELGCRTWPVHCLTTKLTWLPGSKANRARAVATAWGGSIDHSSLCSSERRLNNPTVRTTLACQIRFTAVGEDVSSVSSALGTQVVSQKIIRRARSVLQNSSATVVGGLSLTGAGAWSVEDAPSGPSPDRHRLSWEFSALVSVGAVLLIGVIFLVFVIRRKSHKRLGNGAESQV